MRVSVTGLGISSSEGIQLEAKAPEQLLLTWLNRHSADSGPAASTAEEKSSRGAGSEWRSQLLNLPAAVDAAGAKARFDVKRQRLVLELPVRYCQERGGGGVEPT